MAVLVFSTLISIVRGFVREALSLVTLVAAMIISKVFGPQLSTLLTDLIEVAAIRYVAAYLGLFFATLIVGGLINSLVVKVVSWAGLSGMDKMLGMLFGFARGALIVVVIVAVLARIGMTEDIWWQQSLLIPRFVEIGDWLQMIDWENANEMLQQAQSV